MELNVSSVVRNSTIPRRRRGARAADLQHGPCGVARGAGPHFAQPASCPWGPECAAGAEQNTVNVPPQ